MLGDVDSQEREAVPKLCLRPLDVDGWMWASIPPEVHDELLGLSCVEQQIVGSTTQPDDPAPPRWWPHRCL